MKTDTLLKQAILAEQDFPIDLTEFRLEGEMNDLYSGKGFPQRITCHWVDKKFMRIELRGYVQAVYYDGQLFKVAAMQMQWMLIQRAFKSIFGEVKCYE